MNYKFVTKDAAQSPTPKNHPSFLDKITAYATFFATVISAIALVVSIYTIILTSKQATEQSQMQMQQHVMDSVQDMRLLVREDSLSKLHDSMSKEQLRLLKIQSIIISEQQKDQHLGIRNEALFKSPKFDIWFDTWAPDTTSTSQKIPFRIKNTGLIEALEDTIELFFYDESSKRCIYRLSFVGILPPNDTIQIPIDFTAKWYNTHFNSIFNSSNGSSCYLVARYSFRNPMMSSRQNNLIGWDYHSEDGHLFRTSLGPGDVDEISKNIFQLYSSDLEVEMQKDKLFDSTYQKINFLIKNKSQDNLQDVEINLTIFDGDARIGYYKNKIKVNQLNSSKSFPTTINLPEKLSSTLKKDGAFGLRVEYKYKTLFDRNIKNKKAIFIYSNDDSKMIKLEYNSKSPLAFNYLLYFEQALDECEIIW